MHEAESALVTGMEAVPAILRLRVLEGISDQFW